MIALAVLAHAFVVLAAPSATPVRRGAADTNLSVAAIELEGPFDSLELVCGSARTLVRGPLGPRERRIVRVPFVGEFGGEPERVPTADPPSNQARFRAWDDGDRAQRTLPRGLRARPGPALERSWPRPRASALSALGAAGVLVLLLWRRTRSALAISASAAALLALPLAVAAAERTPVRVLEGDAASGRWVWVESGFGSIELDGSALLAVAVHPEAPAGEVAVEIRLVDEQGPPERWTIRARGRRIDAWSEASDLAGAALDARENGVADFEHAWLRGPAGGRFEARGAWPRGTPLGAVSPGAAPPGWLASGLPPGVAVLVAALGTGVRGGPVRCPEWLRLTGFPTESH